MSNISRCPDFEGDILPDSVHYAARSTLQLLKFLLSDIHPLPFGSFSPRGNGRPTPGLTACTIATHAYLRVAGERSWSKPKKLEAFSFVFRLAVGRARSPRRRLLSEPDLEALRRAYAEVAFRVAGLQPDD